MSRSRSAGRFSGLATVVAALLAAAVGPSAASAAASFTTVRLGTLGGFASRAVDVNEGGQVVGNSTTAAGTSHAFSWTTSGGMVDLDTLGGAVSSAVAVNDAGQVVGNSATSGGATHAFSWTTAGGMVDLGTLGGAESRAFDVNSNGDVVGWASTASGDQHAFLWSRDGGMIDLGTLGGTFSIAFALNSGRQVVGFAAIAGNTASHAFSWTPEEGMIDLGTLGGPNSIALDVNERGHVTGNASPAQGFSHIFVWTKTGGMIDVGTLGGGISLARAIGQGGHVVGSSSTGSESRAIVWTSSGGLLDLGRLGGGCCTASSGANAVNASGQIVGSSTTGGFGFTTHAFSWTQAGGMVDLDPFSPSFSQALAVNDAGQIAGVIEFEAVLWNPAGVAPSLPSVPQAAFIVGGASSFTITSSGMPTATIAISGELPDGIEFRDNGDGTATLRGTAARGSGGVYPLTITASNGIAPDAVQAFTLTVSYVFSGFFQPVENGVANVVNAGRAIPLKFDLNADQGLDVLADGSPESVAVDCATGTAERAPTPAQGNGLVYDASVDPPVGQYVYVWSTDPAWADSCRQLRLKLTDGSVYTATFSFG